MRARHAYLIKSASSLAQELAGIDISRLNRARPGYGTIGRQRSCLFTDIVIVQETQHVLLETFWCILAIGLIFWLIVDIILRLHGTLGHASGRFSHERVLMGYSISCCLKLLLRMTGQRRWRIQPPLLIHFKIGSGGHSTSQCRYWIV